ncbi:hypothetical protein [Enterobacter sp. UNJFSC 003]|uniref:hypothetical protein n=1 Tax=Enterobacter sp. UNJFSC 003 TaxID=3122077 RepID=UPI002EB9B2AC|nr:hypothetical protein [Serratia liquefaciens]
MKTEGYAPSNSIVFKRATGVAPLREYLTTLGYVKEKRSLEEKEIWSKPDRLNGDLFFLYCNASTGDVELTKVMIHLVDQLCHSSALTPCQCAHSP